MKHERAPALLALLSLGYAACARLALAPLRRLSPDEAFYLCAARRGWPIVDHPPLLGSLLTIADRLPFGLEVRVRLVAVLLQAGTALLIGLLAATIDSEGATGRDRRFAFGVFFATWGLMPWVSGLIATPDAPLLAATAGALVFAGRRDAGARLGLLLCLALAVSAKATGLVVGLAIAFDLRRTDRVGAAIALLGAALPLPLVWPSLVAQLGHVLGVGALISAPRIGPLPALGALLGGILLLFGPATCWCAARGRRSLALLPGATPLVVVLGVATMLSALVSGRAPEPNWIAPAFVPLFAIAAAEADLGEEHHRRGWLVAHVAPALLGIALWSSHARLHPDPLGRVPRLDQEPDGALQLPRYGAPAWSCLYDRDCQNIDVMLSTYNLTLKARSQQISDR